MTSKKPTSKKTAKKSAPKTAAKKKPAAKKAPAKALESTPATETVVVPVEKPATVIYAGDVKNPKTKRRFLDWFKF